MAGFSSGGRGTQKRMVQLLFLLNNVKRMAISPLFSEQQEKSELFVHPGSTSGQVSKCTYHKM